MNSLSMRPFPIGTPWTGSPTVTGTALGVAVADPVPVPVAAFFFASLLQHQRQQATMMTKRPRRDPSDHAHVQRRAAVST